MVTSIAALLTFGVCMNAWVPLNTRAYSRNPLRLYNSEDFDGFVGETPGGFSSSLSKRLEQLQNDERRQDALFHDNWKTGNYEVRGFSVQEPVTCMVEDGDEESLWVGRADGKVLRIELGSSDFLTMIGEEEYSIPIGDTNNDPSRAVMEVDTGKEPVSHLCSTSNSLFTVTKGSCNISKWSIAGATAEQVTNVQACDETDEIVALKQVKNQLWALTRQGVLKVWDAKSMELQAHHCLTETALSWDVDESGLYVGTEEGRVTVYSIQSVLENDMIEPSGQWECSEKGGITALTCGGPGVMARGQEGVTSKFLLTGDSLGQIKQWEILQQKEGDKFRFDFWPQSPKQPMLKKTHLFNGPLEPIRVLKVIDNLKFVSSSDDGSVRVWNPTTGEQVFEFDGFEGLTSVCFIDRAMIVDGMKQYVCINDFEKELEDEDDFDVDDYLDKL